MRCYQRCFAKQKGEERAAMKVAPETDISKCFAVAFCFILCHTLTIMWVAKKLILSDKSAMQKKTLSCHVGESYGAMALYLPHFHDIDAQNILHKWSIHCLHAKKASVAFTFIVICPGTGDKKEEEEVRINKSIKFPFSRP